MRKLKVSPRPIQKKGEQISAPRFELRIQNLSLRSGLSATTLALNEVQIHTHGAVGLNAEVHVAVLLEGLLDRLFHLRLRRLRLCASSHQCSSGLPQLRGIRSTVR